MNLTKREREFYEINKEAVERMCRIHNVEKEKFIKDCIKESDKRKEGER